MPAAVRLALVFLLACQGGKDDRAPPADPDTDTDADADTDPPTVDTAPQAVPEICDDGLDNDLDFNTDCADSDCTAACDADGDGVNALAAGGLDCDDANAAIYPRADEICDALDNDCDGLVDVDDPSLLAEGALVRFLDGDADGFGGAEALLCAEASGWLEAGGDCDDAVASVNPAATEVCNGLDDDCANGADDADPNVDSASQLPFWIDGDNDGYGDPSMPVLACFDSNAIADSPDDCDDTDRRIHPAGNDVCGDAIDQDCDGADASC